MPGFKFYKSYNFRNKDPVIDELRTIVQDSKKSYNTVHLESGVSVGCIRGMFDGKTKRPQTSTVEAIGRACGWKRKWVKDT